MELAWRDEYFSRVIWEVQQSLHEKNFFKKMFEELSLKISSNFLKLTPLSLFLSPLFYIFSLKNANSAVENLI